MTTRMTTPVSEASKSNPLYSSIAVSVVEIREFKDWSWSLDSIMDLESLLTQSSNVIVSTLRSPLNVEISVILEDEDPGVAPRDSTKGPFFMRLCPKTTCWCEIVYQFAHEFCHILSNFETVSRGNPNTWFDEVLSELASAYMMLKGKQQFNYESLMPNETFPLISVGTEGVLIKTPTDYWKEIVHRRRDDTEVRTYWEDKEGNIQVSLNQWLEDYEVIPLRNQVNKKGWWRGEMTWRNHFRYVAITLLPIFLENPNGWNAIRKLPDSDGMLMDYLQDWYTQVDDSEKEFVAQIAAKFDYTVK